jgi:hypothetical protein
MPSAFKLLGHRPTGSGYHVYASLRRSIRAFPTVHLSR